MKKATIFFMIVLCLFLQGSPVSTDTTQSVELSADDGSFENAIGLRFGGTLSAVNRLTPAQYPATLKQVKLYFKQFTGVGIDEPIKIIFAPNESGDDNITHLTFQTLDTSIFALDRFFTYDVPDLTINSGDFVVGFTITHQRGEFPVALDGTTPLNHRSYVAGGGINFTHIEDANLALIGNFGIRAQVTITQTCAYTLSPSSQNFGLSGGTGTINVTTSLNDCDWTATTSANWITLTPGSGRGNGMVTFTVAANTTSGRMASINIANQVFTVTQSGLPLPQIISAFVTGKKLFVLGQNFDAGATILIDGKEAKKVSNDPDNPTTILVSKKAGTGIASGQTVKLQVRNANGLSSPEFPFTRP